MTELVCRCSNISVEDVTNFYNEYPDIHKDQIKNILNIGIKCGSCNYKDCIIISKNFYVLYESLVKCAKS